MKLVSALLAAVIVWALCSAGQMFNPALPAVLPALVAGGFTYIVA